MPSLSRFRGLAQRLTLRFAAASDERDFVRDLRAKLSGRVVAYHWATFVLRAAILILSLVEASGDAFPHFFGAPALGLLLQAVVCLTFSVVWFSNGVLQRWWNWEVTGIASTAILCAAVPLTSQQLPADAAVPPDETTHFLCTVTMVLAFSIFVPVRHMMRSIVPISAFCAHAVLAAPLACISDPAFAHLMLLAVFFAVLLEGSRCVEIQERERWSGRKRMLTSLEVHAKIRCDIFFDVTEALTCTGTTMAHDMFFGTHVEGSLFTNFLAGLDGHRFQDLLQNLPAHGPSDTLQAALQSSQGLVDVGISVIDLGRGSDRGRYLVGIRVLEDCVSGACSDGTDRITPISEEAPVDFLPGAPAAEGAELAVGTETSVRRDRSDPMRHVGSDRSSHRSHSGRRRAVGSWMQKVFSEKSSCSIDSLGLSSFADDEIGRESHRTTRTMVEKIDASVNTTVVMDGFSFRCVNCSKPPKNPRFYDSGSFAPVVPGPEALSLIAKLNKKKGIKAVLEAPGAAAQQRESVTFVPYTGTKFDGSWRLISPSDELVSQWLHTLEIANGRVRRSDGNEEQLQQPPGGGPVQLRGGSMILRQPGYLVRTGRSGVAFHFLDRVRLERDTCIDSTGSFRVLPDLHWDEEDISETRTPPNELT